MTHSTRIDVRRGTSQESLFVLIDVSTAINLQSIYQLYNVRLYLKGRYGSSARRKAGVIPHPLK